MLLEGLETLCLLASEGTMAKVASRLYISQSAVSKRITQLEQRLGKRLIEPDEVASLALWLASDSAGMVTGASYTMDGGWTAR